MSLEEIRGEDALRDEIERLHGLLGGKTRYVDCVCEGCPRTIPEAWLAGMCGPCSREDCDHDESAIAAAKAQGAAEATAAIVAWLRGHSQDQCRLEMRATTRSRKDFHSGACGALELAAMRITRGDHIKQETKTPLPLPNPATYTSIRLEQHEDGTFTLTLPTGEKHELTREQVSNPNYQLPKKGAPTQ